MGRERERREEAENGGGNPPEYTSRPGCGRRAFLPSTRRRLSNSHVQQLFSELPTATCAPGWPHHTLLTAIAKQTQIFVRAKFVAGERWHHWQQAGSGRSASRQSCARGVRRRIPHAQENFNAKCIQVHRYTVYRCRLRK